MNLYREFELKGDLEARALYTFLRNNREQCVAKNKPLLVIVTNDAKKRNGAQNRRYWKAVLAPIAEQAFVGGRKFSAETWHIYYAEKFLPRIEVHMPDGSIRMERTSTTDLKVAEFAEYMTAVEADAASELGVMFTVWEAA